MLHSPLLIAPSPDFWMQAARAVREVLSRSMPGSTDVDLSAIRVVVPGFTHAQHLRSALAAQSDHAFIPPRITTLPAWLTMLPPDARHAATSHSERLMQLYAELKQHGWLKKLFAARRNTDLLPLAQTLIALFDELSCALLPAMQAAPDIAEQRWQAALEQLPASARAMLSDEAQLVWSLWKGQLDGSDPTAVCMAQMTRLAAERADAPLVWIGAQAPDPLQQTFLNAYAQRQPVWPILPDWNISAIAPVFGVAWPEAVEHDPAGAPAAPGETRMPTGISLCPAASLEDEAMCGAQTIIEWLQAGKDCVAIIAQDRVVARRIRALLERAGVAVADETGWKLSTTRSAAAVAALLDAVGTRGDTVTLLDLLKSPFVFAGMPDKAERLILLEHALRRFNVLGGWDAIRAALSNEPAAMELAEPVARQAGLLLARRSLADWSTATGRAMEALGMREALAADTAGAQVIALLDLLGQDCGAMTHSFSFAEWRAFLGLQLESTPFVPLVTDRRVVMLQLNGARLRRFDAVLMVGADAGHLPSVLNETLFFANAVRRELGLATREARHCMQLRDLIELLNANPEVVLSWQSQKNGEPNPMSSWIERLELALEHAGAGKLRRHSVRIAPRRLVHQPPRMPQPRAPQLLPRRLSASAYNSLVACPYQFFATRMLGLGVLEELSGQPEKRDYGDWLHEILKTYHETLRDKAIAHDDRESLLRQISEDVFRRTLAHSAAALGYFVRWQKVIPAYLAWATERESKGWKFIVGEQWFEKTLVWESGQITLHGCIDRIDENEAGERAILDYKTRSAQSLREKLKDADDHQLAFYGVLSDVPVALGHFVALEVSRDKTGDVEARDYREWQQQLEAQIIANVTAIAQGASLSATGIERICTYCDVRGLCRKGVW